MLFPLTNNEAPRNLFLEETPLVSRREDGFVGSSLPCLGVSDKSRRRPKDSRRIANRRGAICRDDSGVPNETAAARRAGLNDGRRLGRKRKPRPITPPPQKERRNHQKAPAHFS